MKTKFSGILTLLLAFVVQLTFAQEKTISGTVSDNSGLPLPGVNIIVKGTTNGTQTDFDGNYSITASTGDVLVFSYIGQKTQEVTIGASNSISVTMEEDAALLEEVVVTALGIKREKKSLGYSTQEVKGEDVNTVKDPNFMNSLSGKVAGIDIQGSGTIGGSTNVVIRGYSSLTGTNQALFVVDGVPISNFNTNDIYQQSGRNGYDYGNAASDVNPDDIESVNVLKGGAATALYGSRAANGVIVITTKKGTAKKGIGVTINSSVTFNKFNKDTFAEYQNQYGAGYADAFHPGGFYFEDQDGDGIDEAYTLADWDGSFGTVEFDPNLLVHQWDSFFPGLENYGQATPWVGYANGPEGPASLFETGVTTFNTIALDGGNDVSTFKIGYTKMEQTGIMPNSLIKRDNIDFAGSYKLTDKLTAAAKATYTKTSGKGRYGTGYSGNYMQTMRQWWQTNVSIKDQRDSYFQTRQNTTWNTSYINHDLDAIYHDNVYFMRYESYETDVRNRVFGNVSLNYEINDWLSVYARATMDTYSGNQEERQAKGSASQNRDETSVTSYYSKFLESFTENNYDLMFNINKDITDKLNLTAVLGANIMRQSYSSTRAFTNGGLNVDRLYSLSNSVNPIQAPTENDFTKGVDGYYANASFGYDNTVFVEGSYRIDVSSTLPTNDNQYDYYGISASLLFNRFINAPWISLGKIRAGYAKTGNSAPALSLYNTYILGTPFSGNATATLPNTSNNPNLTNEESIEKEIGLEMNMFNGRLGFDLSLYQKDSNDLLTPITVTNQTGYTGQWLNAGTMENKGIELALWGSPVKTDDFEWKVNVNWGKNENVVTSLPSGLTNLRLDGGLQNGTINASVGEPYGMIRGTNFIYHENGQRIITPDGNYATTVSTNENLGSYQPDWKGGINNTFTYKNLSFSFLIDVKKGGHVFSLDQWYGNGTGLYPATAGNNELGNPVRSPVADGGGILFDGVQEDGTPNTVRSDFTTFFNGYGWASGSTPTALHVYDAGFVKLREVALAYSLPKKMLEQTFINSLTFTAIGRNLWIIDKSLPMADPEAGLSSGNIQGN
ncbi:MAG TPA: SusC/RagA family TonB-linked outer membrane protein, partial [Flavobacteriaceae bacterium]|nr:SusC/RagA family TonB-linked outer membrane protein [Flavobacteriaceae bacterium]